MSVMTCEARIIVVGYGGEKFLRGKLPDQEAAARLPSCDLAGKKTGEIEIDAHPESFSTGAEDRDSVVFVNVPDKQEVEVADLVKVTVPARWPVSCTTNFPMALDEAHHPALCRVSNPCALGRLRDTESGKIVASPSIVEHTSMTSSSMRPRAESTLLGEGFIDVLLAGERPRSLHERDSKRSTACQRAHGSICAPIWENFFEAIRHRGAQAAQIDVVRRQTGDPGKP